MKQKKLSFLIVFLILVVVFSGLSCSKSKRSENKLHLYNWTYYTPDDLVDKFEKETGIEVVIDSFASNEEMFAKIMAGGNHGYDIIFPSSDYTSIMITKEMLIELDHSKLPNLRYIDPLVKEKATYDPDFKYSVPYFMGTAGIAVNKSRVPADYERSWNIFADERLKGRMSLLDDMREVMGAALMYLGYDGNSVNPKELDEATDLIITKWKPNIVKFDSESFGKAFSRNEFYVVQAYAENVFLEVSPSVWDNIDFFVPEEGGMMYIDNMVIPKGAKNVEAAHMFINYIHDPENYAIFLDDFFFPPTTNTGAKEFMENDIFFFESGDLVNNALLSDLGGDLELYNKRWQKIRYEQ